MNLILAADLLSPNAGLAFWITLTFLLLLLLLRRYAWGPITSALTAREERIRESIDQAQKALDEAKQIQADNDKARREAEADAQRMLRDARETAEKLRAEEVDKTRTQVRQMQEAARSEIERERDSALETLRGEVASLAIQAAERVVKANLDDDRQRKLVGDFLDDLSKN